MKFIENIWYPKNTCFYILAYILQPFSLIFFIISSLRRYYYLKFSKKTYAPGVPVIVIGGITVGGSGKTPLCIEMVKYYSQKNYKVGVLSRGYKGQIKDFPYEVGLQSNAKDCGDEPLLIKRQCNCPVIISPDRKLGAKALYEMGVNLIICDDGLQHYSLIRDIEIIVIDGYKKFGNRFLLPAGPLREGRWRLHTVDAVVLNGDVVRLGYQLMKIKVDKIEGFVDKLEHKLKAGTKVCALAGIGNPQKFYKTLEQMGLVIEDTIDVNDHMSVDESIIYQKSLQMPVIMTAKDAVKYNGANFNNVYVLNIRAHLPKQFYQIIDTKLESLSSVLHKRKLKNKEKEGE